MTLKRSAEEVDREASIIGNRWIEEAAAIAKAKDHRAGAAEFQASLLGLLVKKVASLGIVLEVEDMS